VEFSVIIATFERYESLHRLLDSIIEQFRFTDVEHEVLVANNAQDDDMAQRVANIVEKLRQCHGDRFRHIREQTSGKCKAQNSAIAQARGAILAFFDDDVVVAPNWLTTAVKFFREKPYDAMQGPILMPPEMRQNEEFLRAQHKFRTINFVRYSSALSEIKTLTGANMAIRKEVFFRVGGFNEDLGPGRSGISEDVEFAMRLRLSGGRIGYAPEAAVYHEVDWSRLTEEFFRHRHEQQGRSRLIYKRQSLGSILADLTRSFLSFGWYSVRGNVRKQYRAKGRVYHYRAMLKEKARQLKLVLG
jgi:GT2 family glycosyltransferase